MKCPKCGEDYPSATYFKTPDLCHDCFRALPDDEKSALAARYPGPEPAPDHEEIRSLKLPGKGSVLLRVLGVVVAALGFGTFYFLWTLRTAAPADAKIVVLVCLFAGLGVGMVLTGRWKLVGMTWMVYMVSWFVVVALGLVMQCGWEAERRPDPPDIHFQPAAPSPPAAQEPQDESLPTD